MTSPMPDPEWERTPDERVNEIRARLAAIPAAPWSWSQSYEIPGEWGMERHWCLHNPESSATGRTLDGRLVLFTAEGSDMDGKPLDQTPTFQFIANAPADITALLDLVDSYRQECEAAYVVIATVAEATKCGKPDAEILAVLRSALKFTDEVANAG